MVGIRIKIGHLQHIQARNIFCKLCQRNPRKINTAVLHLFDDFILRPEHSDRLHQNPYPAVCPLLDKLCKILGTQGRRIIFRLIFRIGKHIFRFHLRLGGIRVISPGRQCEQYQHSSHSCRRAYPSHRSPASFNTCVRYSVGVTPAIRLNTFAK